MHTYTFHTVAHADACRAVTKGVLAILHEYFEQEDILHSFDLLLTEAISNCARHAYKDMDPGDVEIVLAVFPGMRVECTISDWGIGFSKTDINWINPTLSQPEAEGGRGLYIIASLSSAFRVTQEDGKNSIHATLEIPGELWTR